MKSLFDGFNWNSVRIINAFDVLSPNSGTYIKSFGDTEFYQIGIKFNGETEIYYNDKRVRETAPFLHPKLKAGGLKMNMHKDPAHTGRGGAAFLWKAQKVPPENEKIH